MIVFNGVFLRNGNDFNFSNFFDTSAIDAFTENGFGFNIYNSNGDTDDVTKSSYISVDHITVIGDINLHNKSELATLLYLQPGDTDIICVAKAFIKWGMACVQYLIGEFIFAIWDVRSKEVYLVRDPLGQKGLFYYLDQDVFIFSNSIHFLSSFKLASALNDVWIANYLQRNYNCNRSDTIYSNVSRLEPGYYVTVSPEKKSINRYWDIRDNKYARIAKSPIEAAEELGYLINNAVRVRLKGNGEDGIELSGGLDSSVAAFFAQGYLSKLGVQLTAFSNILPKSYQGVFHNFGDEWHKSSLVAKHLGIKSHIGVDNIITPMLQLMQKGVDVIGYPTRLFLSLVHEGIFNAAQQKGITNLVSGYGGDQMVTTEGYIRHVRYLIYRGKIISAILFSARQSGSLPKAIVFVGNKIRKILGANNYRFEERRKKSLLNDYWLLNDLLTQFNDQYIFNCQSVKDYTYEAINSAIFLERLETGNLMADAYGMQYQYPLIDTRLIQYFFHLPDEWKSNHIFGRALIREVIKNRLPKEIVNQRKVANVAIATVPFGKVLRQQNFANIKEWCLSFSAQHDIFNFIDRNKLIGLTYSNEKDVHDLYKYDYLRCMASMIMFMEKTKKCPANALLQF